MDAVFKPGEKLGFTDIELQVEDRFPLRPYFGYENSGTRFTGEDRLLAGINWGNALWLDHQANYQYSTDIDFDLVKAHSASYVAPLPWRHTLMLYGSYVDAKAQFPGGTTAEGHSWQASARYSVPMPDIATYRHEVAVGFDFKRANNNLLSGGTTVLQNSDTDIAQFVLAYAGALPDPLGKTSIGLEFYYSPGRLTADNYNTNFNNLRVDAKADYVYGRLNVVRLTRLPYGFSWALNFWAQLANERLLPSEELSLGGYNTIRGYDERAVIGDDAWILSNELRTPAIYLGNLLQVPGGRDELQLLGFFDCGGMSLDHHVPADGNDLHHALYSIGAGLRYTISRNLSVRFDYGIPLSERGITQHQDRAHIGILLSL